ncbi:MAG: GNAT family N-acetyltransferase [Candidatus Latescibacteria bacterium]|nr:GNAT family N-acetyltransferase [Candidatus Latescibacterota bacterium]
MNEQFLADEELDHWVEIAAESDPLKRAQGFCADFERLRSAGVTHIHRHYYSEWDGFAERKAAMEMAGVPILQEKRTFSWNEPKPPIAVPARLTFRPLSEIGQETFLAAVEAAYAGTLDRSAQHDLAHMGGRTLAACVREEWDEISAGFSYQPNWFQLAYNDSGETVGYTQPVVFPDCKKDDLEEGSLYHIAVLPQHRGHGYIDDLLAQSVATLQKVGVWRIFCDTDSQNSPMIKSFQRAGFDEEGVMHRWQGEIAALLLPS